MSHAHKDPKAFDRRSFLHIGGLGLTSALVSGALPGIALGAVSGAPKKTLVFLFQRGGADPLYLFPPATAAGYQNLRPSIAVNSPSVSGASSALSFVGQWGLHPLMAPLLQIPNIAFSPSTSFSENNRSHFDCQKYIETGASEAASAQTANPSGIFNKYLQLMNTTSALQGVAAGHSTMPISLLGAAPTAAISTLETFALKDWGFAGTDTASASAVEAALQSVLSNMKDSQTVAGMTRKAELSMLNAIQTARQTLNNPQAKSSQTYSSSTTGNGLRLIAQLLKANVPVSVAALDWANSTWDTHVAMPTTGAKQVDLADHYNAGVAAGASDLLAFYNDIGADMMKNVVVMVGSEFGRTLQENGNAGSDHGVGGAWLAFGGTVAKGINLVQGSDYSLSKQIPTGFQRNVSPDIYSPFQIDCKDLIGEVMVKHLGLTTSQLASVYPMHTYKDNKLLAS